MTATAKRQKGLEKMARDVQITNVIAGQELNVGNRRIFTNEFPMGPGYYVMRCRVGIALTIGTGLGAKAEGELLFIKNITLKTDKGEMLCNLPGRALYKIGVAKAGSPPQKNAIAAATGTYFVDLPIYFSDRSMLRPEDTILDTARYNSISLEVTLGSVSDLLTTVGTASVTSTLDVEIEHTNGRLPAEAMPLMHISYGFMPPVDASVLTNIQIDRATDLMYKRFFAHASAAGTAGESFSGANADDVQRVESIEDHTGFIVRQRIHEMIQSKNKDEYTLESIMAGITVFDFVQDGSISSSLWSGDKAKLNYVWSNKAGVAAGDIVSLAYEGVRALRP